MNDRLTRRNLVTASTLAGALSLVAGAFSGSVLAKATGNEQERAGDRRKAAAAMIAAVDSPEPPLRLLLGADAIGIWEHGRDAMTAELERWRQIGENTAYDDVVAERPSL